MSDNPEDCPVCFTPFDNTERRPRTLPCGHTFCTLCINEVEKRNRVQCPTCRVKHRVPRAGQFPISYTIEAVIERLRGATHDCPPDEAGTSSQEGAAGLGRAEDSLLQDKTRVLSTITACQDLQSQLEHYLTALTTWHHQQQHLEDTLKNKLHAMIGYSRSAREMMQLEKFKASDRKEQLDGVLQTLQTVRAEQQAGMAAVDVIYRIDDAEQRVQQCRQMFPDVITVTTARKVMAASNQCLEGLEAVLEVVEAADGGGEGGGCGAGSEGSVEAAPAGTIMDRFQVLAIPTLEAGDLLTMTQPARNLLQAGLLFAAHTNEGQTRLARIRVEGKQLCLYSLREQDVPPGASILQVDKLVPPTPPCKVFLDVAWPGRAARRVVIRLGPDTPLGRHFVWLCTGRCGPSYRNTRLWWVGAEGQPGECVYGGDYQNNNGTGGAALLPGLELGEYWRSGWAGAVWGSNALFGIITINCHYGDTYGSVFGEVVSGLDVMVAAARHSPIQEVTVVDCGVLWLI